MAQSIKPRTWHVYLVTNKVNGMVYVGKTFSVHDRWRQHVAEARGRRMPRMLVHLAIREYGAASFTIVTLGSHKTESDAMLQEERMIRLFRSQGGGGYNVTSGGQSGSHPPGSQITNRRLRCALCHSHATRRSSANARYMGTRAFCERHIKTRCYRIRREPCAFAGCHNRSSPKSSYAVRRGFSVKATCAEHVGMLHVQKVLYCQTCSRKLNVSAARISRIEGRDVGCNQHRVYRR